MQVAIGGKSIDILYDEQRIAARITQLAYQISGWHAERAHPAAPDPDHHLLVIPLLRGSFVFAADLLREMSRLGVHPHIDFMTLSSYDSNTESSGEVVLQRDIREVVKARDILLVDDILDSGRTLHFARSLMVERGARQVKTAVLLEKPGKAVVDIRADYIGFSVPDQFVVGYGLDYAHQYRELPFIGVMAENTE